MSNFGTISNGRRWLPFGDKAAWSSEQLEGLRYPPMRVAVFLVALEQALERLALNDCPSSPRVGAHRPYIVNTAMTPVEETANSQHYVVSLARGTLRLVEHAGSPDRVHWTYSWRQQEPVRVWSGAVGYTSELILMPLSRVHTFRDAPGPAKADNGSEPEPIYCRPPAVGQRFLDI